MNGPYGNFCLQPTNAKILFVAGGSGMAPIRSMLLTMRRLGIERECQYFFGAGTPEDLYELELMQQLSKDLKHFEFIPSLSRPPEDFKGLRGLVTDALNAKLKSVENTEAYLCGSPAMIDAVCELLEGKGLSEDKIFYDKFS